MPRCGGAWPGWSVGADQERQRIGIPLHGDGGLATGGWRRSRSPWPRETPGKIDRPTRFTVGRVMSPSSAWSSRTGRTHGRRAHGNSRSGGTKQRGAARLFARRQGTPRGDGGRTRTDAASGAAGPSPLVPIGSRADEFFHGPHTSRILCCSKSCRRTRPFPWNRLNSRLPRKDVS